MHVVLSIFRRWCSLPMLQVEDLKLIEDVGNIWNHVPVAREWTPLDPKSVPLRGCNCF